MLKRFLSFLLDLLASPRRTQQQVRNLTLAELEPLLLRGQTGLLPYQDTRVRALVWEVKYYADEHAAHLCGALLADALIAIATESIGKPLMVPIPMHPTRRRARGHNQTEVLCEAALLYMADFVEYRPDVLVRTRNTPPQQGLQKHIRGKNLENSMLTTETNSVNGRICIVVDDVSTTGATFAEAARALRAGGARQVIPLALAQTI